MFLILEVVREIMVVKAMVIILIIDYWYELWLPENIVMMLNIICVIMLLTVIKKNDASENNYNI